MNKENLSEKEWMAEFRKFTASSGQVPSSVSQQLLSFVRSELNPSLQRIFAKGLAIHAVVAVISLIFCPQFGIGFLSRGDGLMAVYMTLGPAWCALFCGATFLGLSSLLTAFLLKPEEIKRANSFGYAYFPLLTAISFAALMLGGGRADVETFALWSLGAFVGGWGILKLGAMFRFRALSF